MRVLNVNISLDTKIGGGTAERTFQMTKSLRRLGVDCKVIVLKIGEYNKRSIELGQDNIILLKCLNKRFYIPTLSLKKIISAVKEVDLVHLMNHWTLLNAIVYFVAKLHHKPYVICPAGSLSYFGRSGRLKKIYNYIIGKKILCNAAYCIAISSNEIMDFQKYGVSESKISVIPNGINEEKYYKNNSVIFREKFCLTRRKIILFVGRLNPIKGIDLLVTAFSNISNKLSDYQLVIAGPDEGLRDALELTVKSNRLTDRIIFVGYLDSVFKNSAYLSANLLVIPSRNEAMSIVVLEAGMNGVPVLLTNKCGFNEVERINGGKVVEATAEGIEEGLLKLLANEEQLKNMGINLKKYIKNNYMWNDIAKSHLRLFNKISYNSLN